jgi:hypothetical protein
MLEDGHFLPGQYKSALHQDGQQRTAYLPGDLQMENEHNYKKKYVGFEKHYFETNFSQLEMGSVPHFQKLRTA